LAAREGLRVKRLFVDGQDVYAEFVDALLETGTPDIDLSASDLGFTGPALILAQPPRTSVNTGFNQQPDGQSAISLTGRNFKPGAILFANGRRLETVFGNSHWLTALFPADIYAHAGVVQLKVVNPDGKSSNIIDFHIR
jgi:hypothetical protein